MNRTYDFNNSSSPFPDDEDTKKVKIKQTEASDKNKLGIKFETSSKEAIAVIEVIVNMLEKYKEITDTEILLAHYSTIEGLQLALLAQGYLDIEEDNIITKINSTQFDGALRQLKILET